MTTPAGTTRSSAEAITAVIAERVRNLRERSGLSQAQLAGRMAERGVPWKRATVVNLETRAAGSRGKGAGRDVVTAQELLALAVALDVPLVWLLIDPLGEDPMPIARGVELDPWTALLWLIGQEPLGEAEIPGSEWRAAAGPISYVTTINQLTYAYRAWMDNTSDLIDGFDIDDSRDKRARALLSAIARETRKVAALGYPIPALPAEIRDHAAELGIDLTNEDG